MVHKNVMVQENVMIPEKHCHPERSEGSWFSLRQH